MNQIEHKTTILRWLLNRHPLINNPAFSVWGSSLPELSSPWFVWNWPKADKTHKPIKINNFKLFINYSIIAPEEPAYNAENELH